MHEDEVSVSDSLVNSLLRSQFHDRAHLPLHRLDTWGTDHVIYRLGAGLSVRLPKVAWAAGQGHLESRWLPVLAPGLPVQVPLPVHVGHAALGYPFTWYIAPWLEGENPSPAADLAQLAGDLARTVRALQAVDPTGGPVALGGQRGGPLAAADASTRAAAESLRRVADVDALLALWDAGRAAPPWSDPPRWVHGDLMAGNLLLVAGRLTAVIDWGGLKVGDPAVELMAAWSLFDVESRATYRAALGFVDDAMWLRGRAWAISAALMALPYYRDTNPDIVARSWRTIEAVLSDCEDPVSPASKRDRG